MFDEQAKRRSFTEKQSIFQELRRQLEDMKKERDLSFRGMGGKADAKRGNIKTGKGGKGRTLRGRRSKTVGGTRGGVPSLAALSGMKAVKGKGKGKGKKGKDEE